MEWLHVALVLCSCVLLSSAEEDFVTIEVAPLPATPPEVNNVNSRIVGGAPTTIEKYPFAIQLLQSNSLACGGSLITSRHVLTAAHCFFNSQGILQNVNLYTVRAGTRHLNGGEYIFSELQRYNVPLRDNDIAVLLLQSSFTFNTTVSQIMLPPQNSQLYPNTPVWAVGWGVLTEGAQTASPLLNEVQVFTINHEICISRYMELEFGPPPAPGQYTVTPNNMCSGILDVGGRDACQGDSGGPVVYESQRGRILVGVTAWGYGCARQRYPGVNMRVSAYTTWINDTVTRHNASPDTKASGVLLLSLLFTVIFSSKM